MTKSSLVSVSKFFREWTTTISFFAAIAAAMFYAGSQFSEIEGSIENTKKIDENLATLRSEVDRLEQELIKFQSASPIKGETGEQGPRGSRGEAGPKGATGDSGSTGPAGAQGPQGVAGKNGKDGPPGRVGPQGEQGDIGPAGPEGPQGAAGENGKVGLPGPEGPPGPEGATGPRGAVGPVGPSAPTLAVDLKVKRLSEIVELLTSRIQVIEKKNLGTDFVFDFATSGIGHIFLGEATSVNGVFTRKNFMYEGGQVYLENWTDINKFEHFQTTRKITVREKKIPFGESHRKIAVSGSIPEGSVFQIEGEPYIGSFGKGGIFNIFALVTKVK